MTSKIQFQETSGIKSYRELHKGSGPEYHDSFMKKRYRRMMWNLERNVIDQMLARFVIKEDSQAMDFACGTGRVLHYMANRVGTVVGVDIANSMLKVAAEALPSNAKVINADITTQTPLNGKKFDVITAFRFFPNAEDDLRDAAMGALKDHLRPDGILIFNNHQNAGAIVRRVGSTLGLVKARNMNRQEVHALVKRHKLVMVEEIGLGVLPFHERFMPAPVGAIEACERILARYKIARVLGQNVIVVTQNTNI